MKILHISNLFPPHFIGGYEIAAADTMDALSESGHQCVVLTSNYQRGDVESSDDHGVHRVLKLHSAWGSYFCPESECAVSTYNTQIARNYIDQFSPDIVCCWNVYGLGIGIVKYLKRQRIPFTSHVLDLSILHYQAGPRSLLLKLLGRGNDIGNLNDIVDYCTVPSHFLKEEIEHILRREPTVIYPYLAPRRNPPKSAYKLSGPVTGVYVGQIERHKGVETICQAAAILNGKNGTTPISLQLYGASVSGYGAEIVQKYGAFVKIITGKPRHEIINDLPAFDVGFFPSIWEEPFGIAQIELMQAGLPVFVTGQGGSKEALADGNHILFRAGDANDLAEKMSALFRNYDHDARAIGTKAAAHIESNFSKEEYVLKIERHLSGILGSI
jgi:glycogen(starch) synthase